MWDYQEPAFRRWWDEERDTPRPAGHLYRERDAFAAGYDAAESDDTVIRNFALLMRQYGLAPDEELADDAKAIKEKVLRAARHGEAQ